MFVGIPFFFLHCHWLIWYFHYLAIPSHGIGNGQISKSVLKYLILHPIYQTNLDDVMVHSYSRLPWFMFHPRTEYGPDPVTVTISTSACISWIRPYSSFSKIWRHKISPARYNNSTNWTNLSLHESGVEWEEKSVYMNASRKVIWHLLHDCKSFKLGYISTLYNST